MAANIGFDAIRKNNRACWAELWKSRIRLVGAEKRGKPWRTPRSSI